MRPPARPSPFASRLWLLLGCALATVSPPLTRAVESSAPSDTRADQPLVWSAFQTFLEAQQRFAYEETHSAYRPDGSLAAQSVVRVDPSQPPAQQSVPVMLNGKPPTEKELKDWAKGNEAAAKRRLKLTTNHAIAEATRDQDFRIRVLNREVTPVFAAAAILTETDTNITYTIPLRELGGPDAAAVTDYELKVQVNRARRVFERAILRQTKMVRIVGGRNYDGVVDVEFSAPDADYVPIPVRLSTSLANKPLFGPLHTRTSRVDRKDFRRVTPYEERFQVKLAPLQLIEF